jgi:hypothetical protein
MYSEQSKVKAALAVDRRREVVGMPQVCLTGKSGVLSEPMMTYGFCKLRTESLERWATLLSLSKALHRGRVCFENHERR